MSSVRRCAIVAIGVFVLGGCSGKTQPDGPLLVSYGDTQRAVIDPATSDGAFSNIMDKLNAIPQDVYADTKVYISDSVINKGLPSKGVKVLVRGSCIQGGLLGAPEKAIIKATDASTETELPLENDAAGGWKAVMPDLKYEGELTIQLVMPAVRGGQGDVQLFVLPLDKKGKTSAVFKHNYNVLSEHSGEISVPGEN